MSSLKTSPGQSAKNPDKSLVVIAIEKGAAPKRNDRHSHAVKRQHGCLAVAARIAVL